MDSGGMGWSLITIIGPIVLAVVLIWAIFRNRTSKAELDRTEQATRELYREQDAVDKAMDNEVKR
ncbi:hypothetical protein ABC347_14750 [Sphingomonas sp. 1P06PA]|uniref:hypothetical protein n=1 Tax=Sphingomonas sp. 1P06PA TaxID=554121 RepID=UPI0039A653D0